METNFNEQEEKFKLMRLEEFNIVESVPLTEKDKLQIKCLLFENEIKNLINTGKEVTGETSPYKWEVILSNKVNKDIIITHDMKEFKYLVVNLLMSKINQCKNKIKELSDEMEKEN